ncbi:MAG: DUF4157 domain-containing protein [Caulobacteraceae bacterium]
MAGEDMERTWENNAEKSGRRPAAEPEPHQSKARAAVDLSPRALALAPLIQGMRGNGSLAAQFKGGPEDEKLQMLRAPEIAQLEGAQEDEPLQAKSRSAQGQGPENVALQMRSDGAKPTRNDSGLPDALKSGVETLSGLSLDDVRVHYNSDQPAQLNALAYAQGRDIHIAPGQERHLPHEAWHVVQQAQGRVQPTMQMKDGVRVNDDAGLEHEADVMGAKALAPGLQSMGPGSGG